MPNSLLILALAVQIALAANPQIAPGATLESILPGLIGNGDRYAAALPSLACEETAISQRGKRGKVKEEVRLEATIQVSPTGDALRPFNETYRWKTRDDSLVDPGKSVKAPYFVGGVFANGLGFSNAHRIQCFDKTLEDSGPNLLLKLQKKLDITRLPECSAVPQGLSSRITIDRVSGHVTHLERTIPAEESERRKEPFFATIDYAPIPLGEETFWLPIRGEMHDANDERRMTVEYRGCRRFVSSMKIIGTPEVVSQ